MIRNCPPALRDVTTVIVTATIVILLGLLAGCRQPAPPETCRDATHETNPAVIQSIADACAEVIYSEF